MIGAMTESKGGSELLHLVIAMQREYSAQSDCLSSHRKGWQHCCYASCCARLAVTSGVLAVILSTKNWSLNMQGSLLADK